MLRWRLLLSAVLIPAFCGLFWLDARFFPRSAVCFLLICLALAVRCVWELAGLLAARDLPADRRFAAGCTVLVVLSAWSWQWLPELKDAPGSIAALGPVALALALSVLLVFLKGCIAYRAPGRSMETIGCEMLIVTYVGLLTALTAQLRWVAGGQAGYLALGSLLIAVKFGDSGAYTLGRLFGKRKMTPLLSPGKTWMGGLGALVGAALGAWLWLHFTTSLFVPGSRPPAAHWALLYGVILGMVGLVGDLAESLIKRDVGRKDAAPLFPGFGGLLDLLDSILYAGPVALVLWWVLPLVEG